MYDSSYVSPQNNFRVVQDNNPVKEAVISKARERYEKEVKAMADMQTGHLQQHQYRVECDDRDVAREKYFMDLIKKELKKDLDGQIKANVSETV